MSNADLIKRLSTFADDLAGIDLEVHGTTVRLIREASDALEQCERQSVEYVHEINKLKLTIQRMERRR